MRIKNYVPMCLCGLKRIINLGLLLLLISSCSPSDLENALRLAGDNRAELEQVLTHYKHNPADSLKYKAACFLIENMPIHYYIKKDIELYDIMDSLNRSDLSKDDVYARFDSIKEQTQVSPKKVLYDIQTLSSGFLIQHIDQSFSNWYGAPWKDKISFGDFCEYILPYSVFDEKRELWIDYYREKYLPNISEYLQTYTTSGMSLVGLIDSLNKYLITTQKLRITFRGLDGWSPLMVDHIRAGSCNDYVARSIYMLRSLGIPAGSDYSPMWESYLTPHSWNSCISDDGKHYPFVGFEQTTTEWAIFKQAPKVFRTTYSIQKESLRIQNPEEPIPAGFLQKPNIKDVSSEYFSPVDVTVTVEHPRNIAAKTAYLCVFNNNSWIPVHWGYVNHGSVTFTDMRDGLVYLPAFYSDGKLLAANDPFILDSSGRVIPLKPHPTKKETLKLDRKFHSIRMLEYKDRMLNGRFQGANKLDFSDCDDLYVIEQNPKFFYNTINIDRNKTYRYVRYIGGKSSYGNIAELDFYTKSDSLFRKLQGEIIGTEKTYENRRNLRKKVAFDGDILTYFYAAQDSAAWVGLDLGKREQIARIRFYPRNDDNNIRSGDTYELFYWDKGQWNSLGQKTGDETHVLIYDDCPSGALFLLHNHTRGKEERIFMYENGRQMWW